MGVHPVLTVGVDRAVVETALCGGGLRPVKSENSCVETPNKAVRSFVGQRPSVLVTGRARLGCTRMGSPGIFGVPAS